MKRKNDRDEETLVRLFGAVSRARVLRFLYSFPGQSFYQREILSETGLTLLAVQRELGNLVALGIIKRQETVNRVYPDIAENLAIWTWVNRSERLHGEPLMQGALTFQTPAGVHYW